MVIPKLDKEINDNINNKENNKENNKTNNKISLNNLPKRLYCENIIFNLSEKLKNKTKKDFEIVIARYDEDLEWCKNYLKFTTVYNKGNDLDIDCDKFKIPNIGHLADTILKHIIFNYNNLSNVTFFTHGSFNYRNDQIIRETKPCHKTFESFIHLNPNHIEFMERYEMQFNKNLRFYNYPLNMEQVYIKIFKRPFPNIRPMKFAIGKWMSVGKNIIRRVPKQIYINMLNFVLENYNGKRPTQHIYRTRGIYIERLILHVLIGMKW